MIEKIFLAFLVSTLLCVTTVARAFDPFTALAVANAALGTINGISGNSRGLDGGVLSELTELYQEIDSSPEISEDGQRLISNIDELNHLARELGMSADEIAQLMNDIQKPTSNLAKNISNITRSIRTGKQLVSTFNTIDNKVRAAQLEGVDIQRQQLKVLYSQLARQQMEEINAKKTLLREKIALKSEYQSRVDEMNRKGFFVYKDTRILAIPMRKFSENSLRTNDSERSNSALLAKSMNLINKTALPISMIVFVSLIARLVMIAIGLKTRMSINEVVMNAFGIIIISYIIPDIIVFINDSISGLSEEYLKIVKSDTKQISSISIASISNALLIALHYIQYIIYIIGEYIINILKALTVLFIPAALLASAIFFNFSILNMVLMTFFMLSLVPVIWNAFGAFSSELMSGFGPGNEADHAQIFVSLLIAVLQVLSPLYLLTTSRVIANSLRTYDGVRNAISNVTSRKKMPRLPLPPGKPNQPPPDNTGKPPPPPIMSSIDTGKPRPPPIVFPIPPKPPDDWPDQSFLGWSGHFDFD